MYLLRQLPACGGAGRMTSKPEGAELLLVADHKASDNSGVDNEKPVSEDLWFSAQNTLNELLAELATVDS